MSLKELLILGPKIKESSSKDGFESLMKLYQKEGYLVVGDGERDLTAEDILLLEGKFDSNTRIDIYAHGYAYKNEHFLHIFDGPTSTAEFFDVFKYIIDSKPLNIHLWSCYGKFALKDIGFLPKNSVLIVHAGDKPFISLLMNFSLEKAIIKLQSSDLKISPFQLYLNEMPESIQESHIITQINDKTHQFSIIPQTREILESPEGFLNQKVVNFIKFYKKIYKKNKDNSLYIREKILLLPNFTTQEIGDFRSGSFIANCYKNYQILKIGI